MILDFDLGNSRIKWRILDSGGEPLRRGVVESVEELGFDESLDGVQRVRAVSVASEGVESALTEWISAVLKLPVEFAKTAEVAGGVICGYLEPAKLGVDRWAAVVAGYSKYRQAVVVVDVGSALTIDMVTAQGEHLGGYIIPGHRLMSEVLLSETSGVRYRKSVEELTLEPGNDTAFAVERGIQLALSGAIEKALKIADQNLGQYRLLFTGGGAEAIIPLISRETVHLPELVLDGLEFVLD